MRSTAPSYLPFFVKLASCLGLATLLATAGCSAIQVKLGTRISLAKVPIVSMEATLPQDPGIAPGEKSPLVVSFTDSTGKVLVTEGKGKGKVLWKDVTVTPTVVTVNKKGVISLAHDPRLSDGKTGHVSITIASHPNLHADLDIPLRYNYPFKANFSGSAGSSGNNGLDGTDGTAGSPGSLDPNNPSPGGNGSNGGNGTDGTDGGNGGDAQPVDVRITLRSGNTPLLQAVVSAPGAKDHFYLIDPQGGSLTIDAEGGPGGSGGKGGRAGRGGAGGIGSPNGSNGSDGFAGHDGSDGRPGSGGSITVTYDPQVKQYLSVLHLSNPGGPKPVFKEQPVGPLW